ncbi:L antigen family member 3-like isoform X1 [Trachinotus anak]|uniref:L antigen family member 3-like isoform X1 n=1 Tax=Trachinotus anak TaxID=443729 RepID=UPI0039F1DB08
MAASGGETNHESGKLELYPLVRAADVNLSLDVPFPSSREADIALRSLSPDREPRKGGISKQLTVAGSTLSVRWSADEARILRVSVNSFLDHLSLVVETMQMFGPPVSQ